MHRPTQIVDEHYAEGSEFHDPLVEVHSKEDIKVSQACDPMVLAFSQTPDCISVIGRVSELVEKVYEDEEGPKGGGLGFSSFEFFRFSAPCSTLN